MRLLRAAIAIVAGLLFGAFLFGMIYVINSGQATGASITFLLAVPCALGWAVGFHSHKLNEGVYPFCAAVLLEEAFVASTVVHFGLAVTALASICIVAFAVGSLCRVYISPGSYMRADDPRV